MNRRTRPRPEPPDRFTPLTHDSLSYDTSCQLRYAADWLRPALFWHAGEVYDAILALRDGVSRPGSPFKIRKFGSVRFNETVDWLGTCGYPVAGMKLPAPRKTRR